MFLRAPFSLTLNVSRDGTSTTSLGSAFQCLTTLIVKNFFMSSLNLPSFSLKSLPLAVLQQALLKSLSAMMFFTGSVFGLLTWKKDDHFFNY